MGWEEALMCHKKRRGGDMERFKGKACVWGVLGKRGRVCGIRWVVKRGLR